MRKLTFLFCLLSIGLQAQTQRDFKKLCRLFAGEFDNATQTNGDTAIGRMHIHIAKVNVSFLGKNVFFVQYQRNNNPNDIYRPRLYSFKRENGKITSESCSFVADSLFRDFGKNAAKQATLTKEQVKVTVNCPSVWTVVGTDFVGKTDSCKFFSARRKQDIYIFDRMRISKTGMGTTEAAKDESGKILFGKLDDWALDLLREKAK
jgi:CpeT/CpcT family (DUF1001)